MMGAEPGGQRAVPDRDRRCPSCGSAAVRAIVYGLVEDHRDVRRAVRRLRRVLRRAERPDPALRRVRPRVGPGRGRHANVSALPATQRRQARRRTTSGERTLAQASVRRFSEGLPIGPCSAPGHALDGWPLPAVISYKSDSSRHANFGAPQSRGEPRGQGGHVQLGVGGRLRRGRE